jgi:hypothetical protein
MLRITSGVAFIAFFEPGDCFRGGDDRLVGVSWVAGTGKLVVTN